MVIACARNGNSEKILIIVNRLYNGAEEEQELCVIARSFAGLKEVNSFVCGYRLVIVFAAAVNACKGLLVKQANHIMLLCNLLHNLHCELVMVGRNVCC